MYQQLQEKLKQNASLDTKSENTDIDSDPDWQFYLSKSKVLKQSWSVDQKEWTQLCAENVNAAVSYLNENKQQLTAKSFYTFLAKKRGEIAEQLNQYHSGSLGRFRRSENDPPRDKWDNSYEFATPITPISTRPPYSETYNYLRDKLNSLTRTWSIFKGNKSSLSKQGV